VEPQWGQIAAFSVNDTGKTPVGLSTLAGFSTFAERQMWKILKGMF
jgi:hypothetical protein